ncbi:MAG: hypothetical protein EBZ69_08540 [Alphaproteobacteria bacterium]|nr:hypothetical protein [Alphaproteobacteria bacterium]NDC56833.1 hypothetical protein [Alphaproteobacteria bacterium]NDG04973.1 hypothetical protein [Alphaproteobacteria bacterium]
MRELLLTALALAVVLAPAANAMEHEGKKEEAPVAAEGTAAPAADAVVETTTTGGDVKTEEAKPVEGDMKADEGKKEEHKEEGKH